MKTFLVLAVLTATMLGACTRDNKNDLCATWQQPPIVVEPSPVPVVVEPAPVVVTPVEPVE